MKSIEKLRSQCFLSNLLNPWEAACLLDSKHELLDLKAETLADLGTLPWAGKMASQYLNLGPGDVVILNDPFSGGTLLSYITLIYGMEGALTGLTLVVRTGFRARLSLGEKLDEEGLRIPPTPLMQKGLLMEPILEAICSHPEAPHALKARVLNLIERMRRLSETLNQTPPSLTEHKKISHELFLKLLGDIPHGEVRVEHKLPEGETLRLKMEVKESQVLFDFSGTTPSKRMGLTDAATLGICAGAFLGFYHSNLKLTSQIMACFDVSAPLGSWLNSKYPTPTFRGMTEGSHIVAHLVSTALSQLATHKPMAASPTSPTWISFEFAEKNRFFDCIPTGIGAAQKSDGASALHIWIRSPIINSIEQIESRFPIEIEEAKQRTSSGGKGHTRGGDGIIKKFNLLESAEFTFLQSTHTPEGVQGGGAGQVSQILVNEKPLSSASGKLMLKKGDCVEIQTAGGGGYGKIRPPA